MDDMSVHRVLGNVASTLKRSFVVPELKSNLLAAERKAALQNWGAGFKKKCVVLMGEPSEEYKLKIQSLMLKEKQAKADAEKKKKTLEEERKKLAKEKIRKAEEAKKARELAQKKK